MAEPTDGYINLHRRIREHPRDARELYLYMLTSPSGAGRGMDILRFYAASVVQMEPPEAGRSTAQVDIDPAGGSPGALSDS